MNYGWEWKQNFKKGQEKHCWVNRESTSQSVMKGPKEGAKEVGHE